MKQEILIVRLEARDFSRVRFTTVQSITRITNISYKNMIESIVMLTKQYNKKGDDYK